MGHPYAIATEKMLKDLKVLCTANSLSFDKVFESARKLFQETPEFTMLDGISAVRGMIQVGDIQEEWKLQ